MKYELLLHFPPERPFRVLSATRYKQRRNGWTYFYKGRELVSQIKTDQIISIDKVKDDA